MKTISCAVVLGLLAMVAGGRALAEHPPVTLLDHEGKNVLESGQPVSTMRSCSHCHDTGYISTHSYHTWLGSNEQAPAGKVPGGHPWDWSPGAFGRWNPLVYRYLTPRGDSRLDLGTAEWIELFRRHVGGGPAQYGQEGKPLVDRPAADATSPDNQVIDSAGRPHEWNWQRSGTVEMNCFLCHTAEPDNQARLKELAEGRFQWANTATLASTGLVQPKQDGWTYRREAFSADGKLDAAKLGIREPRSENCGQCHGLTDRGQEPLKLELSVRQWSTATKGQVFSPQRISESAANVKNKEHLARPWDVHAERLLECASCHFSINNPAFYEPSSSSRPGHLAFEPRRLAPGQYIEKPSHQFAKGRTSQGTLARHLDGTMRDCRDCHRADQAHRWLPYQEVHFASLSCEACHIPQSHAPAIRQVDWTLLSPSGEPQIQWRGVEGDPRNPTARISGFRPVLLPKKGLDGQSRLVPHNLISSWYWVEGEKESRPVRLADLRAAICVNGTYHPEVARVLGDGRAVLDTAEKVDVVRRRLEAVGVVKPRIEAEVQPYSLHHGVGPARWATRTCETCHTEGSRLGEAFELASYVPAGRLPRVVGDSGVELSGQMQAVGRGQLAYCPSTRQASLYVLGHDRWLWVNAIGGLSLVAVAFGVVVHAGMRVRLARRKPKGRSSRPQAGSHKESAE